MKQQNITKKRIAAVLRSLNRTEIYRLVAQIKGSTPTAHEVLTFIEMNAPTLRVKRQAYTLAYEGNNFKYLRFGYDFVRDQEMKSLEFAEKNIIHNIVRFAIEQVTNEETTYTKVPMVIYKFDEKTGESNGVELIFANKSYKLKDYNRWDTGCTDKAFAEKVVDYVKKHINY